MKRFNESLLVLSCMATIPMIGCDQSDDQDSEESVASLEIVPPQEVAKTQMVELDPEDVLVARIDGEQDGMVDFLNPSAATGVDEIIVVAVGAEGNGVTRFLDEGASPLEVYLALASNKAPPAALVENHSRLAADGRVPTTPRKLETWRENNVGGDCANGGFPFSWWEDWYDGYGSIEGHMTYTAPSSFANGSAIQVSNSTKRALEACAFHYNSDLYNVKIQTYGSGIWWTLGSYNRPEPGWEWGVATRSISTSGTLTTRLLVTNYNNSGTISFFFWGGAYST